MLVKYAVQITGHDSGSPSFTTPAITLVFPFSFAVPCTQTTSASSTPPGTAIGSTCTLVSTYNAILTGIVPPAKREVWEYGQVQVYDGGADGLGATEGDNTLFEVQGEYFP